MEIGYVKINSLAIEPKKASEGSVGFDLFSVVEKVIKPGKIELIKTGICIELPLSIEAQIRSRSGLSLKHGIFVLNSPGTIDTDYRGEIGVILANFGEEEFKVEIGDRIAQMVFSKVPNVSSLIEVKQLSPTLRDAGGFGHTGRR